MSDMRGFAPDFVANGRPKPITHPMFWARSKSVVAGAIVKAMQTQVLVPTLMAIMMLYVVRNTSRNRGSRSIPVLAAVVTAVVNVG